MAEFVLDFLRCVMCERDIFGVDPEQEQKGILSVGSRARDDFFYTKTHKPRVCCKTTHTLKHARREREREREATMMLMTAHTTTTTTSAPSDDVPPLLLRCF